MTGPSIPNVVIVVVVITGDSGEDLASPATTAARPAEARSRQEHAQADSGQSPNTHPTGTPGDDTE
jgi:hypothetical protein